jgi:predicted lipoprotein with Yx(FWY)xxD motif
MNRTRSLTRLLSGAGALALSAAAISACGGGGSSTTAAAKPTSPDGSPATFGVAGNSGLGKILVNSNGLTLYLFKKDTGTKSTCAGACATNWPPLRASGKPLAGTGLSTSKVGTTARSDGKPQITYNGHPLYLFQGDSAPGQTNGQGISAFGAPWFAVSPAGNQVNGTGSGSGGAGGY